jgi:phytoene/squalene synthetase
MNAIHPTPATRAETITRAASMQTFLTIRFLVDRGRAKDAYLAYAYFRWVDDFVDMATGTREDRCAFLDRQRALLEACYRGRAEFKPSAEESMLVELIRHDLEPSSGLQIYLRNMMEVMDFDARRRGRLISQAELDGYTSLLSSAVTEAMHFFIGHDRASPHDPTRYLAVAGAHVTHMLRDTFDDLLAGYYNTPRELLEAAHIGPQDVHSEAHRDWVRSRVQLARKYFSTGRKYLARVEEPRCRLAGYAYMARFEWLLDVIEAEDCWLRAKYSGGAGLRPGLRLGRSAFSSLLGLRGLKTSPDAPASREWWKE